MEKTEKFRMRRYSKNTTTNIYAAHGRRRKNIKVQIQRYLKGTATQAINRLYLEPVCSKQTGLVLWFWFQIGFTVSNKCIVCYNHDHHGNCSNQTLLRMIWSGKHQCVILENINDQKQQCSVKNNHFCAMNFMTKFCCRHILFSSEHIFGHTKRNKPHPSVVWSVW